MAPNFSLGGACNRDRDRGDREQERALDIERDYYSEKDNGRRKYSATRKDLSLAPPLIPLTAPSSTSHSIFMAASADRDREKERPQDRDQDRDRVPREGDSRALRHGPPLSSLNQSYNGHQSRIRPSSQHQNQTQLHQHPHSHSQPSSFSQSSHQHHLSQFLQSHSQSQNYHCPPLSSSSAISSTSSTSASSSTLSPSPSSSEWPQQQHTITQRHTMDERLSVGNLRASFRSSVQPPAPSPSQSAIRASTFSTASIATTTSSSSGQLGTSSIYDSLPPSIGRSKSPARQFSTICTNVASAAPATIASATVSPNSITPVFGSKSTKGRARSSSTDHASPSEERRLGIVFLDSFNAGPDAISAMNPTSISIPPTPVSMTVPGSPFKGLTTTTCTSDRPPPPIPPSRNTLGIRSRTFTMDSSIRQPSNLMGMGDFRTRVGSFSAASSSFTTFDIDTRYNISSPIESMGYPSVQSTTSGQSTPPPPMPTSREKKVSSAKRLIKRNSSRPTSPVPISPPPCIDSLPTPIPTTNTNKILLLMKTLCGRMRGNIDYQMEAGGPWHSGVCWIEEDAGCLMFDSGQTQSSVLTLCGDLRGSRIESVEDPDSGRLCIDLITGFPLMDILIRPSMEEEFDLWMAALLCWQQVRSPLLRYGNSTGGSVSPNSTRPELRRQGSSTVISTHKAPSIIKVAKVSVWDKGHPTTPRGIYKSPSILDPKPTKEKDNSSWARLSCLLQDNGELKLLTENDSTLLSLIDLTQLSRSAIQRLDRTIFEGIEFCLAIFPIYVPCSTKLSVFRPIYMSFESRVFVDVWYVLLRAFAKPHLFLCDSKVLAPPTIVSDIDEDKSGLDVFRVERTLEIRLTEAKLKPRERVLDVGYSKNNNEDAMVGNYFAEVMLDGEIRTRTAIKNNTKTPFWREDCSFVDIPPTHPLLSIVLKRINGQEPEKKHHFSKPCPPSEVTCGSVDIPMDQLDRILDHEQWLQILDPNHQSIGTMLVKVQHEEMAVLLTSEYEPLREILQRFPTGLTSQIARLMPSSLRRIAEVLLNIFQASGKVNEWLMALVEEEIDGIGNQGPVKHYRFSSRLRSSESIDIGGDRFNMVRDMSKSLADEANLLFRGNSLLTQALECHMRRLGKEYLEDVLRDKILEINEMNPNCEIDPSKLEPGDDVNRHAALLTRLTTEVWNCIAQSVEQLPADMRHILKYVRAVAEDRYGDFLRAVSYTSVTGFLFLRFICPAILSPKLFGMLRDLPTPRAQRTFTLMAKVLQAMANLSSFGQKESWMEPMNKFLNLQRASLKSYVDDVCTIPADQSKFLLSPAYSTPQAIMNRMSSASREGIPTLPFLIDSSRSLAVLVKLWTDAHGTDSTNLPSGDILLFNGICHALQRRADACIKSAELLRNPEGPSTTVIYETELNPISPTTPSHPNDSPATSPAGISGSMSATSLSSMGGNWSARELNASDRAPGSAGSDIIETSTHRRKTLTQDNSSSNISSMRRVSGTTIGSISGTTTNSSALSQPNTSGHGGLGRLDIQSLAQLQLQMGQTSASTTPVDGMPMSPPGTMRGARPGRSTRNILSGIIRMGRSGDQTEGQEDKPRAR